MSNLISSGHLPSLPFILSFDVAPPPQQNHQQLLLIITLIIGVDRSL